MEEREGVHMKKSILILTVLFASATSFAAPIEGKSRLWDMGADSSLVIEGATAEKLYDALSSKPVIVEDADNSTFRREGENYSCFKFTNKPLVQCVFSIGNAAKGALLE